MSWCACCVLPLQTGVAHSLSLSEDLVFCGCADGTVRAFSPVDLHFVCTLPRPHALGSDVSAVTEARWGRAQQKHGLCLAGIQCGDQMPSIYSVSCLKWQDLTVEITPGCLRKSIAGFMEERITIISLIIIITVLGNHGLIIFTLCLWRVWLIILLSVWGTELSYYMWLFIIKHLLPLFHISFPSATCFAPNRTPVSRTPSPWLTTRWAAGSAASITTTVCTCGTWETSAGWGRCTPPSSTPPASGTWR